MVLELRNVGLTMPDGEGHTKDILKNINLKLEPGKLYGVTGPNGGGKTSLAKVIMGIYRQTSGEILLDGQDISELPVDERARRGISYAFQQPPRFKGITVGDLLLMASGPGHAGAGGPFSGSLYGPQSGGRAFRRRDEAH